MVAIRVVFDGTAFVPQQPVTLPDQSEGRGGRQGDKETRSGENTETMNGLPHV